MALISAEVFAFTERTERRAIYISDAPPLVKAAFALTVIFLIVGLLLLPGVIVTVARARGYRAPYLALTIAAICYVLNRLLFVVYYLLSFSDTAKSITWVLTSNVAALWGGWTDVFVFLAVLLLLQNRASSLVALHPQEGSGCGLAKKLGDWILVGLMWLWVLVTASVFASANSDRYHRKITTSEQIKRFEGSIAVRHLADAFTGFLILINIGISSLVLRSRISKYNNARDKPTNAMALIIFPVLIVHYIYRMYIDIQSSSDFFGRTLSTPSLIKRNRILNLISILETAIIIGAVFIVFIVIGYNHERWNTFGHISVDGNAEKLQWAAQQTPGVYQQYQQSYVNGQVYPQPQPTTIYTQPQPQQQLSTPMPQTSIITTVPIESSPPVHAQAVPGVPQV